MKTSLVDINKFNLNTAISEIGLVVTHWEEGLIKGELPYSKKIIQPFGLIHGGIYCVVAESLASIASNLMCEVGMIAVGQSLTSQHLRPVSSGKIFATAEIEHKGKTSHLWNIKIFDEKDKLVHVSRMQMAIVKKPN